jgi:polyisoprenyl-phosphate glycosyltransferase
LGALFAASIAVLIRLLTDMAIPGWTTTVVGLTLLIGTQAFVTPIMMVFMMLSNRSNIQAAPKDSALLLVSSVELIDLR